MEVEMMGAITIGIVVFVVAVIIIISFSYDIRLSFISKIKGTFSNLYSQIFGRDYYNICQAYDGDYISFNDFGVLLNAYHNQKCEDRKTSVILSFSLSKEDVKDISKDLEIAKEGELIYYGSADEPLGIGGIIIDSVYDDHVFKFKDNVTIWNGGSPEKDTLLKLTGVNCDVYSNTCDFICKDGDGICPRGCTNGDDNDCSAHSTTSIVLTTTILSTTTISTQTTTTTSIITERCPLNIEDITGVMQWEDGFPFNVYGRNTHNIGVWEAVDINGYYGSPVYSPVRGVIEWIEEPDSSLIPGGYAVHILGDDGRYYEFRHLQGTHTSYNLYKGRGVEVGDVIGKLFDLGYQHTRICDLSQEMTAPYGDCTKIHIHFTVSSKGDVYSQNPTDAHTLEFLSNYCGLNRPPGNDPEFPDLPTINCAKITDNPNINRCFESK